MGVFVVACHCPRAACGLRWVSCVRQGSEVLFGKWLCVRLFAGRGSAGPPQLQAGTSGPSLNMAQVCLMCLWRSHTRRFMIPNVCFHFTCTHTLAGSFCLKWETAAQGSIWFFLLVPSWTSSLNFRWPCKGFYWTQIMYIFNFMFTFRF